MTTAGSGRLLRRGVWGGLVMVLVALPYLFDRRPPLPPGTHVRVETSAAAQGVLIDRTAFNRATETRAIEQRIPDAVFDMVREARRFVVLDFFLFNAWQGRVPERHRALSSELARALIEAKARRPELDVLLLTDPINRAYGDDEDAFYAEMVEAGIPIVFTDLNRLPDSNRIYAAPARFYGRLLLALPGVGDWLRRPALPHAFQPDGRRMSPLAWARLLFFKANHRKVAIADGTNGLPRVLVTSWNPADGSSAHDNLAWWGEGPVAEAALAVELDGIEWSAGPGRVLERAAGDGRTVCRRIREDALGSSAAGAYRAPEDPKRVEWLTEGAIRSRLLAHLNRAGPGDEVRIALFYLSERSVIEAIKGAAAAGARVRLLLDPNKDAFGRRKNGVPNRPVAAELTAWAAREGHDLTVRWAATRGEQMHIKAMSIENPGQGTHVFLCGSANWTRRNLNDLNLEANVLVVGDPSPGQAFAGFFDRAWGNTDGLTHSLDYEAYALRGIDRWIKTALYRFQEATGLCTF